MSKRELQRMRRCGRSERLRPFGLETTKGSTASLQLRRFRFNAQFMRQIKLSGREQAVIRAIDYVNGSTGEEIRDRTQLEMDDLADILHGLCDAGYVESFPAAPQVTAANCAELRFETNPAYAQELKAALRRV